MKKKLDLNQLAKSVVEQATGEVAPKKEPENKKTAPDKGRINEKNKSDNQFPSVKSNS